MPENEPIRVLLVDDDEDDYLITREYLLEIEWKRFELDWVSSVEAGLAEIGRHRHHVYLIDYRLGAGNGLDLLREAIKLGCQEPLILLTGQNDREIDLEAMKAGAADYLVKGQLGAPLLERSIRYALERTRTLETLRESEERFRRLVQLSPEGIGVFSEGKLMYINPAGVKLLGAANPEQLLGLALLDQVEPENRSNVKWLIVNTEAGVVVDHPLEIKIVRLDELKIDVQLWAIPITYDGQEAVQIVITDITERKRADEAVRRRNRELSLLNQIIAGSVADMEPEAILEMACRGLARALAIPQARVSLLNEEKTEATVVAEYVQSEQVRLLHEPVQVHQDPPYQHLLSQKAPLIVMDAEHDPQVAALWPALQSRGVMSLLSVPLVIKEEVVGSLRLETNELRDFSAEDVSLAWSVADQMAWALARARMTQTHQRLITVIEQATESVMISDTDGVIVYVNPAFEKTSGYSRAEAIGQTPRLLRSEKHDATFYHHLWETLKQGQAWRGRIINKSKEGKLYTEDATITPVRNSQGTIINYVAVKRDITAELQLEERYLQAQKMEAVGRLTGGIAHDFNNLLTAINGFAELTQFRMAADDPLQELVGKISHSGERAADLVRQLLTFSRKQIIEPKVLNLNTVVTNISSMLRRIIGEDIKLETHLTPDLWAVKIDPTQIEQVVVNLAVNARDAMPNGGRLTISTANIVLKEEDSPTYLDLPPGDCVRLTVSDTGVGMSDETKSHIFEPFFTTKAVGKGTGLGLATVFGIIKQSQGDIQVQSEVGQGTVFEIYLARSLEPEARQTTTRRQTGLPPGNETILLAEDDPGVRELARLVLQRQGYQLLEAQDGLEAIRLFQNHGGNIHLLLTDVVMPGLNGKALAEQLSQGQPQLKMIFMSGYADEAIGHHGLLSQNINFLPKPFNPTTLAYKVRTVLDS